MAAETAIQLAHEVDRAEQVVNEDAGARARPQAAAVQSGGFFSTSWWSTPPAAVVTIDQQVLGTEDHGAAAFETVEEPFPRWFSSGSQYSVGNGRGVGSGQYSVGSGRGVGSGLVAGGAPAARSSSADHGYGIFREDEDHAARRAAERQHYAAQTAIQLASELDAQEEQNVFTRARVVTRKRGESDLEAAVRELCERSSGASSSSASAASGYNNNSTRGTGNVPGSPRRAGAAGGLTLPDPNSWGGVTRSFSGERISFASPATGHTATSGSTSNKVSYGGGSALISEKARWRKE